MRAINFCVYLAWVFCALLLISLREVVAGD